MSLYTIETGLKYFAQESRRYSRLLERRSPSDKPLIKDEELVQDHKGTRQSLRLATRVT